MPARQRFFRRCQKLQRSSLPNQTRQALRPSPSGHEAESRAAMSEHRVRRGDPAVTCQRKIKPSAHAMALDRSDNRSGITGDCVHERLSHSGELVAFGASQDGNFLQIGANGEKMPIARDDQWANLLSRFAPQFADGNGQRKHARASETVGAVRRSKTQDASRTVAINVKGSRKHGNILRDARVTQARVGTDALGSLP